MLDRLFEWMQVNVDIEASSFKQLVRFRERVFLG